MVAGAAAVSGNFFVLELRIVSGTAGQHPLPPGGQEQDGICAHPERQRFGGGTHVGSDCRKLPAGGWQCAGSGSVAPFYGNRPADTEKNVKAQGDRAEQPKACAMESRWLLHSRNPHVAKTQSKK